MGCKFTYISIKIELIEWILFYKMWLLVTQLLRIHEESVSLQQRSANHNNVSTCRFSEKIIFKS